MISREYNDHWEQKFRSQKWGRYPPEDLVRFMARNFPENKNKVNVLEVGCGPGANIWYLHREGYHVSAIDISKTAIQQAHARIADETKVYDTSSLDLRDGNFCELPWKDNNFDVVIDIFALYANKISVIENALQEIHRVLKDKGRLYTKLWGKETTGYNKGKLLEKDTFDDISEGPCFNMGITHFFDQKTVQDVFGEFFFVDVVDVVKRTDIHKGYFIEELHCQMTKK